MVAQYGVASPRSLAPDHPDLAVRLFPGARPKYRKIYLVPKIAPGLQDLCVYNNDIRTLERGVKERVLFVQMAGEWVPAPAPLGGIFDRRLYDFEALLRRYLPSTTPVSRHEFAQMYRGRKQIIYSQAVDSLMRVGIQPADFKIKTFVKAEKGKPGKAPRVIQPRNPRANVEIGRYIKPIEERLYRALARAWGQDHVVMKGLNARQVATEMSKMWHSFSEPVAVGLDATRFDQHVSRDALVWEHRQYVRCFRNPHDRAQLAGLLTHQLVNRCTGYCKDGKLKYTIVGKRMSGDMNTGCGNCLLMCAMIHSYCNQRGVRTKLANNGDDCVVFMEKRDLDRFSRDLRKWFLELGFQMEIEAPVYIFERVEFCQSHPVHDGYGYTMIRNLRAFTKDSCCLIPLESEYCLQAWLGAVGDAGMSLTGGIPIWQEVYSLYQRSAGALSSKRRRRGESRILDQSAFETGMMMAARGMTRKYGDVSAHARYSFWLAFGISPDHQIALEKQYRSLPLIKLPLDRDPLLNPPPIPHNGFCTAYEDWSG